MYVCMYNLDLAMLMRSLPGRWANSTAYTHPVGPMEVNYVCVNVCMYVCMSVYMYMYVYMYMGVVLTYDVADVWHGGSGGRSDVQHLRTRGHVDVVHATYIHTYNDSIQYADVCMYASYVYVCMYIKGYFWYLRWQLLALIWTDSKLCVM